MTKPVIKGKTIFRNTISLIMARGIDGLTGVLMIAVISRHFGPQLYGDYAFITSLAAFMVGFTAFGIERIIIRDVANVKQNKVEAEIRFGTAVVTRWLLSIAVIIILITLLLLGNFDSRYKLALLITVISQFAFTSASMYGSVFKAYEKMGYDVLITFIVQLLSLLLVLIAAYLEMGFISIFAALAFANLIKFFLSMVICYRRFLKPKIIIQKAKIISLVKESFILGFNILIVQALLRVDVFILKALKDSVEVSLFYAPHSLILRLQTLPIAFSTALFPYFSRSAREDGDTIQTGFIKAFNVLFAVSIVIMTVGMVFADQIINLIYGNEFMGAILSFRILLPSVVFLFIHPLLDFVLISQNKPSLMVPASLGGLLINVALDFALIPRFGNVGASCASLMGYIAIFGITCYMARNIVTIPVHRFLYIPLGVITLISGVLYFSN